MANDFFIVTCEHGGNRIPSRYRALFAGRENLLATHRGYDRGALRLARDMAATLDAALFTSTISRLLIDLNRSPSHPRLYSKATRVAPQAVREEILQRYYLPYRAKAETRIMQAMARGCRVLHFSCHSFTPVLGGKERNADVGLLYGTGRPAEAAFCRAWQAALRKHDPELKVRLNYPYTGNDDGFTTTLRQRLPPNRYLGVEVEVNQRCVEMGAAPWRRTRTLLLDALRDVTAHGRSDPEETPAAARSVR